MVTGDPINEFLWEVTAPAVAAAREAVLSYVGSGKYTPRKRPVEYKVNEAGWPSVVDRDPFQVPSDAPIDWRRALSLGRGKLSYVVVEDVPALAHAMQAVLGRAASDEEE
ncbi:hypothetical protein ACWDTD_16740 [Gordonia sp. NPDC003425]